MIRNVKELHIGLIKRWGIYDLQAKGISDPIVFYKEEFAYLNKKPSEERQGNSAKQISEET